MPIHVCYEYICNYWANLMFYKKMKRTKKAQAKPRLIFYLFAGLFRKKYDHEVLVARTNGLLAELHLTQYRLSNECLSQHQ